MGKKRLRNTDLNDIFSAQTYMKTELKGNDIFKGTHTLYNENENLVFLYFDIILS